MPRIGALQSLKCFCNSFNVRLVQVLMQFLGQIINNTCQYAMVLYAADPNTTVTPTVIITLGSITYFFSILEIMTSGFIARERRLENEQTMNVHDGEGTNGE